MNKDLLNILAHSNKDIDNQLLMDYISGHLSDADQHTVEEWLQENEFAADALEGLKEFGNKERLNEYVAQLNKELRFYLKQKKQKREKRRWKDNPWIALALILILGFIILAYIVLRLLGEGNH
jgi:hypothetical protein